MIDRAATACIARESRYTLRFLPAAILAGRPVLRSND
jgi:hypothetical protein